MMHMTFYWGNKVTLLFDFWKTDSWISYAVTLLACLIFSVFYQYLEDKRIRFKLQSILNKSSSKSGGDGGNSTTTTTPLILGGKKLGKKLTGSKLTGAVLFGVNSAIGYLLMLAVMSFNGGVFVAVVLGLGFGYLIFRSGDEEEDAAAAGAAADSPCACA